MSNPLPWPPSGVQLLRRSNAPGPVNLPAIADHRVSLHLSTSTRTFCRETGRGFVRRRGDVDLTPAFEPGGFDAGEDSASLEVRIPVGFLQRIADEAGLAPARAGLATQHLLRDDRLTHLLLALDAEQRADVPVGRLYMDSLGVALAVQLLVRHGARPPMHDGGMSPAQLQRAVDYIEGHLDQRLTLARLASVAGVSRSRLQRGFKASKGIAVHRYVLRRRVEHARTLLLQHAMPASEAALAAGFAHQSHMARWMRRLLGVVPTELRS
jgi:AraC family transcriptional regulator